MERVHFRIDKTNWPDGSCVVGCEVVVWSPYGFNPPKPHFGGWSLIPLQATKKHAISKTTNQPDLVTCRQCRRSEPFHRALVEYIKRATPRGQWFGRHWGEAPKSCVDPIRRCRGSWRCLGVNCGKPDHREQAKEYERVVNERNAKQPKRAVLMSRTRAARVQATQTDDELAGT